MLPVKLTDFVNDAAAAAGISVDRFDHLIIEAKSDPFALAELIAKRRWLERDKVGMLLGNLIGATYLDLFTTLFQPEAIELLPKEFAIRYRAIPVYRFGSTATVAIARPLDPNTVKAVMALFPCPVDLVFSFTDEIETAIKLQYEVREEINVAALTAELAAIAKMNEEVLAKYKPVIELADNLLMLAIKEGVSDIHIEPKESSCSVRFRKDGSLRERLVPQLYSNLLRSRHQFQMQQNGHHPQQCI